MLLYEGGLRTRGIFKKSGPLPPSPLISVITPVFNGKKHLEQTIQSVINQSYRNVEYIIVDGGSTDGTLGIIKKYEEQIDYWISEPDKGIYDAMNKGIGFSTGDIIGIINSDDYYLPGAIQKIADAAKNCPEADLFHGNLIFERLNGVKEIWLSKDRIVNKDSYKMPVNHPTVFVRSACYKKYGLFDIVYPTAADFDLILNFLCKHKMAFHYINESIAFMREGGKGSFYTWDTYREVITILSKNNLSMLLRMKARLKYLWWLFMQYSKRYWIARYLSALYYRLREN